MKKFLSLVLALVMTMSLVTISAGATEYKDLTDKDDLGIQYQEAVAVLNKIGVITGYDDGSFRPDVELTRGAAAKIIVSMLLGPEAASNLPNNAAPYPDVPANHTFAGVISYCKNAKIINGYSDGTFKPSDTLTGFAFAKMLLGALGYDNSIEGLSGAGWTMKVAALGQDATLFDRIDFKGGDPVTRKDAALLALNTLKATVVEYKGGSTITAGDATVVTNPERVYKTSNQDYARNILPQRRNISESVTSRDDYNTVEFAEEHFVDLRLPHDKYSPTRDEYGRPSAEWSYKKLSIGTFPLEPDFEYTTQVIHCVDTTTDAAKVRALGLTGYDVEKKYVNSNGSTTLDQANLWINGVEQDGSAGTDKQLAKTADIANYTDNGTQVLVYVDNNGADFITDVVVIKTQLMEVRRVGSDYVSLELYDDGSDGKDKVLYGYNDEPIDEPINNVEAGDDYYEFLSGLKAGDLVAVEPVAVNHEGNATYDVGHAYTPETASGALTAVENYGAVGTDRNAVNVTVGGTKYPIALWNKDLVEIDSESIKVTRKDVTLHLDKYGNTMLAKDVGATEDWMIVANYRQGIENGILVTYANGWDIKGNEISLNVGAHNTNMGGTQGTWGDGNQWGNGLPPIGSLVYYTNNTDSNTAEWDLYMDNAHGVFNVFDGMDQEPDLYKIRANSSRINLVGFGKQSDTNSDLAYVDNGIKFIYVTMDSDGELDSIEIKDGVQNVENNEIKGDSKFYKDVRIAQACVSLKTSANIVNADSAVKAVVIKSESNAANVNNLLYVARYHGSATKDAQGNMVQGYEVAMMNENGKLDNDIKVIYAYRNLQIGQFARYTKSSHADHPDDFYTLRPYGADAFSTAGRSVAVLKGNLAHDGNAFIGANNRLIRLAAGEYSNSTRASGGYKIEEYHTTDHNIINDLTDDAKNLVNLRNASWLDLTSRDWDIRSAGELKDAYSKSFDKFPLASGYHRDITLTLLFNDNPSSDDFRQVYLIVVNSVDKDGHINSGSSTVTPSGVVRMDKSIENLATVSGGTLTTYASGDSGTLTGAVLTAPEWAAIGSNNITSGNVKATVYLSNGTPWAAPETVTATWNSGDTYSLNFTTNTTIKQLIAARKQDANAFVAITALKWNAVKVKLVGDATIADTTVSTTTGTDITTTNKIVTDANKYTGTYNWVITGAKSATVTDSKGTASVGAAGTITGTDWIADGNGYVTITISGLQENPGRTNVIKPDASNTKIANVIHNTTGVDVNDLQDGLTESTVTIRLTATGEGTVGAGSATGFTGDEAVKLSVVAANALPASVEKYTVSVSYKMGTQTGTLTADVTAPGSVDLKENGKVKNFLVTEDMTITSVEITEVTKGKATIASFDGKNLVVDYIPGTGIYPQASDLSKNGTPCDATEVIDIRMEDIPSRAAGKRVTYIFADDFDGSANTDKITLTKSGYDTTEVVLYWDTANGGSWGETEVTTPEPPQAEGNYAVTAPNSITGLTAEQIKSITVTDANGDAITEIAKNTAYKVVITIKTDVQVASATTAAAKFETASAAVSVESSASQTFTGDSAKKVWTSSVTPSRASDNALAADEVITITFTSPADAPANDGDALTIPAITFTNGAFTQA